MAKLVRITNKVFGENANPNIAGNPEISQFGSGLAQTFIGTDDVSQIQSLPAWGQGWIGAVTSAQQFPALSEMTGAMKVLSYQGAYTQQMGISEWDEDTTYYKNSYCQVNGVKYKSLTDDNLSNNPTTSTTNWVADDCYLYQSIKNTSSAISITNNTNFYSMNVSSATTFTFNTSSVTLSGNVVTFELRINMTTVSTITFPSNVQWLNDETPDMSEVGVYYLVFRQYNNSGYWIANLQGKWSY